MTLRGLSARGLSPLAECLSHLEGLLINLLSIPQAQDLGRKHIRERFHETVGLHVLDKREDASSKDDEDKHNTKVKVVLGARAKTIANKAEDTSTPKEEREEIRNLLDKLDTNMCLGRRGEPIGAPLGLKGGNLGRGETLQGRGSEMKILGIRELVKQEQLVSPLFGNPKSDGGIQECRCDKSELGYSQIRS